MHPAVQVPPEAVGTGEVPFQFLNPQQGVIPLGGQNFNLTVTVDNGGIGSV